MGLVVNTNLVIWIQEADPNIYPRSQGLKPVIGCQLQVVKQIVAKTRATDYIHS